MVPVTFPRLTATPAGNQLVAAGTTATHPHPGGFAAHLLQSFASTQGTAAQAGAAFAQGASGSSLAGAVTQAVTADLQAEEFSLLMSKALAAYQSVMNMPV